MKIAEIRKNFPVTRKYAYMNHAVLAPGSKPVIESMGSFLQTWSEEGSLPLDIWFEEVNEVKALFAWLIGAKPDEIAVIGNTSAGIGIIANMFEYDSKSNIVLNDLEFPANVYPWLAQKRRGAEVRFLKNVNGEIRLEDVEKAVDKKTKVISVSSVSFLNGFRHDLKSLSEIAHKHGAYLCVDAIQSVGALRIDVKKDDVDFLACGCYKWLLGPTAIGFMYIREDLIERFQSIAPGWTASKSFEIEKFEPSKTATRFQEGTPSIISAIGAKAALKIIKDTGVKNIENRILALTDYLIENILELGITIQTPMQIEKRSGIVTFTVEQPKEVMKVIQEKSIVVKDWSSLPGGGIRASPHFYNTKGEIDRLIDVLKEFT